MTIETTFALTLTREQAEAVGLIGAATTIQGPYGTKACIIGDATIAMLRQIAVQLPSPIEIGRAIEKRNNMSVTSELAAAAPKKKAATTPVLRPAACSPERRIEGITEADWIKMIGWHERHAVQAMQQLHCGSENWEHRIAGEAADAHWCAAALMRLHIGRKDCSVPRPVFIHLLHGRDDPEEEMKDWGYTGPILGPFTYIHVTYKNHFRCIRNEETGEEIELGFHEDLLVHDGKYYGEYEICGGHGAAR